jgi:hypothetical protein
MDLGGDFNIITGLEEKKGGTRTLGKDSEHFNSFISLRNLIDVSTDNGLYTWTNRHSGDQQVSNRLDHFLLSEAVMMDGLAWNATIINSPGLIIG